MPQSMGLQKVIHDLATEQEQQQTINKPLFSSDETEAQKELIYHLSQVTLSAALVPSLEPKSLTQVQCSPHSTCQGQGQSLQPSLTS